MQLAPSWLLLMAVLPNSGDPMVRRKGRMPHRVLMFWIVPLARHFSSETASGQTARCIHQDTSPGQSSVSPDQRCSTRGIADAQFPQSVMSRSYFLRFESPRLPPKPPTSVRLDALGIHETLAPSSNASWTEVTTEHHDGTKNLETVQESLGLKLRATIVNCYA